MVEYAVLARIGEIALKGLNRRRFEQILMKNMAWRLRTIGSYEVNNSQSRIWVEPRSEASATRENIQRVAEHMAKVFGVVSTSPAVKFAPDRALLDQEVLRAVEENLAQGKGLRFRVDVKRGDKTFPMTSQELAAEMGGVILDAHPELKVDLHQPDWQIYIEIREHWYVYSTMVPGVKGLPVGTAGRAMLLLSGGIDSPVAGYMMASRGLELEAMYFHTFPFTSDQAKEKVLELARKLSYFTGRMAVHVVNFTDIQLELRQSVPDDMMTIVMRRMMMRIACAYARQENIPGLITGESLGQVASQTLHALATTNEVCDRPVFRPLIGTDKDDTVRVARFIDTFETSILPYEDCCTVFVAKHPKTRPSLKQAAEAEAGLDIDALTEDGLAKIETYRVQYDGVKLIDGRSTETD